MTIIISDLASTLSSGLRKIAADQIALADEIDALTPAPPSPVPPAPTIAGLNILASSVASAKAKATASTPQWQAFKARLDKNLPIVLGGGYQGSELQWIADYALGYQALRGGDPATACNYADKAIGLLKSALNDCQKDRWNGIQYLARCDGATKTFTLPNADFIPSSVQIYVSPVKITTVKRSATSQDVVDYYQRFIKVSNTSDGTADYTEGVDWRQGDSLDQITWLAGGKSPAAGASYYVTSISMANAVYAGQPPTLKGGQVTLSAAPDANHVVLASYVYGTHAADGSMLAYQQTSSGDGGLNSIEIDDGYTSRYLGAYVAIGLDWLDGYAGLSADLKAKAIELLQAWYAYSKQHTYRVNSPASNYGAGHYFSAAMTALALQGRSNNADALLTEVVAYHTDNLLPLLTSPITSLVGGFWAEGWNYGILSVENILRAEMAMAAAGHVDNSAAKTWASQVVSQLVSDAPTPTSIYNGGDGYSYPQVFPPKNLFAVLSAMCDDAAACSYANYVLQNFPQPLANDATDLLFRDPSATGAMWTAAPLQNFATGTGLLTCRSDWGANPIWASCQIGNQLVADHQSCAPGQVQIQRGPDDLLVNAAHILGELDPHTETQFGNTLVIDDGGAGTQNYPWNIGFWFGSPGVVTKAYEAVGDYVYFCGDYRAAYSKNTNPGAGGPASELTRQFVYLRPDIIVVYDCVTTLRDTDAKQLRWHFLNTLAVSGDSFVEMVGNSKLFGQTYSTVPLTTTVAPVTVGSAGVQRLITQNASSTASVRYVTAFQVSNASSQSGDQTAHVSSGDGQLEGVQIGQSVVLFGRNGNASLASPISYGINATGSVSHWIANLPIGSQCKVLANSVLIGTFTISNGGILSFKTTSNNSQTIIIESIT